MSHIGLNVIEVDGTAAPAIQAAPTSVAGFVVATPRGPVGRAVLVTSFSQFVDRFGASDATADGPLIVQGFFGNGGGRAWVCRVGGADTVGRPAGGKVTVDGTEGGAALLTFKAGARGQAELGAWGNGIELWVTPSASTRLREAATAVTAGGTSVASVRGFSAGTVAVLHSPAGPQGAAARTERVTLTGVNAATGAVTWDEDLTQPGAFGKDTTLTSTDFDLEVRAPRGREVVAVESWASLTLDRDAARHVEAVLNDPSSGSKWVVVDDARPDAQRDAVAVPATGAAGPVRLADGVAPKPTDADYVGDPVRRTGLHALDTASVQLIGLDTSDPEVLASALGYCEARGDCMLVASVPEATSVETAADFGVGLRAAKAYGALYGPWVKVVDPSPGPGSSGSRSLPPTGHVMGAYARVATNRGIHKAPAGDEARLLGVVDVEYPLTDADHTFLVREGSVNGIRAVPGAGIVVDASRTLSTDTRWLYVNVRQLFNYVKSSLRDGLRWVRQEPNTADLWDAVRLGTVRPFLMGLWRQGAFGTGEPDEVFTITCDGTNNPPDEVDKGNLHVDITFWPSKPAETIVVRIGQQPSGGSASEA